MHEKNMLDRHSILLGAKGDSPKQRMANVSHILLTRNISLISLPMITIEEIEMYCRVEANRQKLGVVVVDYLGLVTSKTKHSRKDLEQNDIAKRLAALSIELDCIVITLIQVNREYKNRQVGQRCPVPSDAAEAMGSVHSASWWLGIDQPYLDDNEPEYLGLFQVQNRKNRYDSGLFKLEFDFLDGLFLPRTQPFCNRYSGKKENTSWIP
jgi:replicative DNA helicase